MRFRDRLEWIFRIALLAFILTSVAFLSALTAMRFAIQGREVVMPNVVGQKTVGSAGTTAGPGTGDADRGSHVHSCRRGYGDSADASAGNEGESGSVRARDCESGPAARRRFRIWTDLSIRAARIELLRSGLQAGEISSAYLPETGKRRGAAAGPGAGNVERDQSARGHAGFAGAAAGGVRDAGSWWGSP